MKKLIGKLTEYNDKYGSFFIHQTADGQGVPYDGGVISYFSHGVCSITYPDGKKELLLYQNLSVDTLLDILLVVMRYAEKMDAISAELEKKYRLEDTV